MFSSCLMLFFGSLANLCGLTTECDILPQFISRERKLLHGAKEESSWQTESGWLSGASSSATISPSQNRFATEVLFQHRRGWYRFRKECPLRKWHQAIVGPQDEIEGELMQMSVLTSRERKCGTSRSSRGLEINRRPLARSTTSALCKTMQSM